MADATPRRRVERAMSLSQGTPLTQHDGRRSCAYPGCTTQLSRYNPNERCSTHGGWNDAPERRSRDAA